MGRPCTICVHADREAIDKALVAGESYRNIAKRTGTAVASLQRHKVEHIPALLAEATQRRAQAHQQQVAAVGNAVREREDAQDAHALDVMEELQRCFQRVNLLFDACDRYLRDPDDSTRYDVGPRSEDVLVTYTELGDDGKPVRRKARLSTLLARAEQDAAGGVVVDRAETRVADPRELVLKATAQLTTQVQLLAKLLGQLDERAVVNIVTMPEWVAVRAALLQALAPYADARLAVATALASVEASPSVAVAGRA